MEVLLLLLGGGHAQKKQCLVSVFKGDVPKAVRNGWYCGHSRSFAVSKINKPKRKREGIETVGEQQRHLINFSQCGYRERPASATCAMPSHCLSAISNLQKRNICDLMHTRKGELVLCVLCAVKSELTI